MRKCSRWNFLIFCAALFGGITPAFAAADAATDFNPDQIEFFETKVRPVLISRCYECHSASAKKIKGNLRLDSRATILQGGDTSPAAIPGNAKKSLLVDAINYGDNKMPPKAKLPEDEIATLTKWVEQGLAWPQESATTASAATNRTFDLGQRKKEHWAWQPVRPTPPPEVKNSAWPKSALDRFLLAKLEAQGLRPAAPVDRVTLLRRLSFDLIGLPPQPAEIEAFVRDESPDAVGKVVDRLLASPQFGERWARHWLDLVRYAESRGHEFDYILPNAFQYRDYVIRALNADVPYNDFVVEHLAGDLLTKPRLHTDTGGNESILGTGFWFLGEWVHSPVDIRKDETDRHDNMLDVMGKTFLGLTIGCARCHDHKFDAITQADYYSLSGFTLSSTYRQAPFESLEHNRNIADELKKARREAGRLAAKVTADALRLGLKHFAKRLLDIQGDGDRNLDVSLLNDWQKELEAAAQDPRHPLFAWTAVHAAKDAASRGAVASALDASQRDAVRQATMAANSKKIVVDYRRSQQDDFVTDGFLFGLAPQQAGTILLNPTAAAPVVGVATRTCVRCDPAFLGLTDTQKNEHDAGALGNIPRSGRTFRTRTFTITDGFVHYLVAGEGWVYAAVDSHHMIVGPLHGQLVRPFTVKGKPQWNSLNLQAYVGQRVHLEFTPKDEGAFAVLAIAQGEQPPQEMTGTPLIAPKQILEAARLEPSELAQAYQNWFSNVVDKLESSSLVAEDGDVNQAIVADWLIRKRELFANEFTPEASLSQQLARQLARINDLTQEVRRTSPTAPAMWDGSGVDECLLKRGSPKTPGEIAPRRFLEALDGPAPLAIQQGSGRLELARRIIDPANPFTARVIVNRVWQHLFGMGIVATVDNFGVLGERPTHPELLDQLAAEFVRDGWSIKRLVRRIALSAAYQQSSQPSEMAAQMDPRNQFLSHVSLRRLEGEAIRDAILSAAGNLNAELYGRSVPIFLTPYLDGRGRPEGGPLDGLGRRSIYLAVKRNFLSPMMLAFDTPIPFNANGRRNVSNVPAQALTLLNDPFVVDQARRWGARLVKLGPATDERIAAMYRLAFGRSPKPEELSAANEFLIAQAEEYKLLPEAVARDARVWADLAHMLFNAKEFIYLQ